jgi:GNAT superfamily N-acetyltransferase
MGDIVIVPKPDWVSWDEITSVLHDAHKSTVADGMNYVASYQGANVTKRRAEGGICYVALIDDKVVGTLTVKKHAPNNKVWYRRDIYATFEMIGVSSRYKRRGILSALSQVAEEWVIDNNLKVIIIDVAVENKPMQNAGLKQGFKYVDYISKKNTNYCSVVMARWLDGCPYTDKVIFRKFILAKIKCILLYTKKGSLRFYIKPIKRLVIRLR